MTGFQDKIRGGFSICPVLVQSGDKMMMNKFHRITGKWYRAVLILGIHFPCSYNLKR